MSSKDQQQHPNRETGSVSNEPRWIQKAKEVAEREKRWQPWKETLQNQEVNTGFEGEDRSLVRARDDVQHSGVAG